MNIRKHAQALAMASIVALVVVSIPAVQAHADTKRGSTPQPNLCARFDPESNHWEFALPGEMAVGANGHKFICGEDGQWHQVADFGLPTPAPLLPAPPPISSASES